MSTLKVNSIEPANAGSEDYFLTKAWVNFNGTGTVAIRADGNVSSITDLSTGQYRINFTSSLVDSSFSATAAATGGSLTVPFGSGGAPYNPITSSLSVASHGTVSYADASEVSANIVR